MSAHDPNDDDITLERDAPTAEARATQFVGQVISNRYRIDELIAMGGMGAVYLGQHMLMRKRVAIKILHPRVENLKELIARFQREAIAGAHIQHPNVASATDFGQLDDGSYFLVLEYVRGATLHDLIDKGPVAPERAVRIARQIAAALDAAHRIGILHRDVKPSNIMLVEGERDLVKLIDFGLSKIPAEWTNEGGVPAADLARAPVITRKGAMFGTIAYMPPEAALGMDTVDQRADLYALGVILYKMLTGKHPFDAQDPVEYLVQHQTAFPPPLAVRTPGIEVPRSLEAVVMKLLKKDVRARFATAEAVINALDAALPAAVAAPTEVSHDALPVQIAGAVPPSIPAPPLLAEAPPMAGAVVAPAPMPRPISSTPPPGRIEPSVLASRSELSHQGTGPPRKSARLFEWLVVLLAVLLLAALILAALKRP